MGVAVEGHDRGEVTLALTLSAMRECTDPAAVVDDAREWSRYVAVVGRQPETVRAFATAQDLAWTFEFDGDKWQTMEQIRTTVPSPRYVFVGVTDEDRTIAMHLDWEFLRLEEAAARADWARSAKASLLSKTLASPVWPGCRSSSGAISRSSGVSDAVTGSACDGAPRAFLAKLP